MRAVALGGGHGTAVVLRALMRIADNVTGIVSVADDGGSSGELRHVLGIPAVGDLRRCLSATSSSDSPLATQFEHRVAGGRHPLGNLVLAAATLEEGNLERAVERVGFLLGCTASVLPATNESVDLVAETSVGTIQGQVRVHGRSDVRRVAIAPPSAAASPRVLQSIADADLIVIGPGSFFTSVLAAAVTPGIAHAIRTSRARVVFVSNLRPEIPEAVGLSLQNQLTLLEDHEIRLDAVLCDVRLTAPEAIHPAPVVRDLSDSTGQFHDPEKVAQALVALMAN